MFKESNYKGKVVADTSPEGIESYLVTLIENEIKDKEGVDIKILLEISDYKDDMSGDVKSGYGAIVIKVGEGLPLIHVPFMIHDNTFKNFDSIRIGEEQTNYEGKKLKKLVMNMKNLSNGVNTNDDDPFNSMSLGDISSLPFDNGFLGTIMSIRDSARRTNNRNQGMYTGSNFGVIEEERMMSYASERISEVFEDFHEKLAAVKVYTEEDMEKLASKIREKHIQEYNEILEAESTMDENRNPDRTKELYRRQLKNIHLESIDIVPNGKVVELPIVDGNSTSRTVAKVYKNIVRIGAINSNGKHDSSAGLDEYDTMIVDGRNYVKLKNKKEDVLIYTKRKLNEPQRKLSKARTLVQDNHKLYSLILDLEKDVVSVPFRIKSDYIHTKENGRMKSFSELNSDGGTFFTSSQSTLFQNVMIARDILSPFAHFNSDFIILISREGSAVPPGIFSSKEIRDYIIKNAKSERDLNVSISMINYMVDKHRNDPKNENNLIDMKYLVVKPSTPLIQFSGFGIQTISNSGELIGFDKVAAYEKENKVRLYINESKYPPTYNISIRYVSPKVVDGFTTSSIEQNNINNLSLFAAKKVLSDIGKDYRDIERMINIVNRNGRYAEENLPSVELAKDYKFKEPISHKVRKILEGVVNSTLNANNYTPVVEDVIAENISDAAQSILQAKQAKSLEVAKDMEKLANEKRDSTLVAGAMLLNIKHGLDKMACDINDNFVLGGDVVYNELLKVASFIPKISEEFYYLHKETGDGIYKRALDELDGLTQQAKIGEEIIKTARVRKGLKKAKDFAFDAIPSKKKEFMNSKKEFNKVNEELDQVLEEYNRLSPYKGIKPDIEKKLSSLKKETDALLEKRKEAALNVTVATQEYKDANRLMMAGIGLPSIAGSSYVINRIGDDT